MPQNKTIKFFISSTFKDFLKERNALQNFVFPRLKKLCQKDGFYFQPVDLRWGVTEESSEDNKTMEYCLNEVRRCSTDPKPNLLILFGQRYGWGPLPSYLTVDECNYICSKSDSINIEKLKKWYIQDLNDLRERYFLKEKKGLDRQEWEAIEKELKKIIQTATKEKKDDNEYSRFHTSATEQEIKDALEKQYKASSNNTIVYFRKFKDGQVDKDLVENTQSALKNLQKLESYLKKQNITSITQDSLVIEEYKNLKDEYFPIDQESYEYPENTPAYIQEFCESIYDEFKIKIQNEIEEFNKTLTSSLKIELAEQERFLKEKSNIVIGRESEVDEILNFVKESNEKYYLLYGKSGSGKTSIMAKAIQQLHENNEHLLYRFIGTTAHTTSPRDTYEYIYWQLIDENGDKPKDIESDDQKFYLQFQKALEQYVNDEKLTLFIDAVDQFNSLDSLEIFLRYVPANTKVVFSVLYDENKSDNADYIAYYQTLEHIRHTSYYNELELLDQKSNIEILKQWLNKDDRTLSTQKNNNQQALVEKLIEKQTPLFLRLVYEIVREWKSTDTIEELKNELGDTEEELIIKFFDNIIKKHYVKKELLECTLGLISASKDGLSEKELIDILSEEQEILKLYEREGSSYPKLKRLPDSIFSKMYYHIQDVFTERLIDDEMLINPYHRVIEEVIKEKYYNKEYHSKLANYFYTLQDKTKTWDKRYNNLHMLSEYPYQLLKAKDSDKLKEILFDLEFAGSIYDNHKQDSFRDIMSKATQLDHISEEEIYPWESFYREKEHLITKIDEMLWRPHQSLFQLAYEDGKNSPLTKVAKQLTKKNDFHWLKPDKTKEKFLRNGLILSIFENIKDINKIILTNNRLDIYNEYCLIKKYPLNFNFIEKTVTIDNFNKDPFLINNNLSIKLTNDLTLCRPKNDSVGYLDRSIIFIDNNQKIIKSIKPHMRGGVTKDVIKIEAKIITWGFDFTLKVWTDNGDYISSLIGHENIICDVKTIDSNHIMSLSVDNTLKIWHISDSIHNNNNNNNILRAIYILPNRHIFSYNDSCLFMYDSNLNLIWDYNIEHFRTSIAGTFIINEKGGDLFNLDINIVIVVFSYCGCFLLLNIDGKVIFSCDYKFNEKQSNMIQEFIFTSNKSILSLILNNLESSYLFNNSDFDDMWIISLYVSTCFTIMFPLLQTSFKRIKL